MKRLITIIGLMVIYQSTIGQLSGTFTIPDDYATLQAAITALNSQGVGSGGVTFNVTAGYTENITAPIRLIATGTVSDTIIFRKNGTGVNPLVTRTDAGTINTGTLGGQGDAIIIIEGSDYVIWDQIDINASDQGIEYGYYLRKASGTDGCKHVTIKNDTITMTKGTSQYVVGIYSSNNDSLSIASSASGITVSSTGGRNENVTITGNTIENVFSGIVLRGYNHTSSPYNFYDQNFIIGATGQGNIIQNYAGNAAANSYGVYLIYHNNPNVSYNAINNTAGGGSNFTSTAYGIFHSTATNASGTFNNNEITLASNTGQLKAIMFGTTSSGNGTYVCNGNIISMSMAGTSEATCIHATGTVNSFTINNNTFSYGTFASTTTSYLINASTATNNVTISGNQTSGTITKTGSGTYYGYYNNGSVTGGLETITNNDFSNITITSGSSTCYGIYSSTSTAQNRNCGGNTVSNITHSGTGSIYGIYLLSTTNNQVNENSVNTLSGGGTIYGLYFSGTNPSVYDNEIYGLATSGSTLAGIYNASSGTVNCFKNQVYDLNSTNAAPTVSGILITSGTANYNYNNYISDIRATASNNDNSVRGINITSTASSSTIGIYYNTVYLDAVSSGTNFGTTGLYHTYNTNTTTASLDMRNNIIVNTSTPNGTGLTVAFRRSASTNLNNYSTSCNNNDFNAGTPGSANLIFYDGTNADQAITAFKARVNPRETASFSENPPFINNTTKPYDLHIQTSTATQCESGGILVSSPIAITTDFDGDTRNASTPDTGADEFTGIGLDLTPPGITYTPLPQTAYTSNRSLTNVAITDASGVNTTSGTRPRVYYKRKSDANVYNNNTSVTDGWKWQEAIGTSSPFEFTLDYSLLNGGLGITVGDTVQYFVVAQDQVTTPNVGINQGSFASQPASVALTSATFPIGGTINYYRIVPAISGIVTVGADGTYPSLTGAAGLFADINNKWVTGNITATIISDLTETGANALNQMAEDPVGSNFTLTIKPDGTTMRTISGSYAGGLIRLNGSDRVIFDGRYEGAGNYLTFTNTATSGTIASLQLVSLGNNAGAANNTIRNCNISTGTNTVSTVYGIVVGGATVASTGADNDNNTIRNNNISKAYVGIWAQGSGTSNPGLMDDLQILENSIGSDNVSDYIGHDGIILARGTSGIISQNTIYNIITTNLTPVGLTLSTGFVSATISCNNINNITYAGTAGWGSRGMYINTGNNTSNLKIYNNLVYIIGGDGYSNFSNSSMVGMYFDGGTGGLNIHYNSVYMSGTATTVDATLTTAVLFASSSISNVDLRNNIFMNSIDNINVTTDKNYAIYSSAPNTAFTNINYNDYHVVGEQGILGFLGGDRTTLDAWKTATVQDVNSLSVDPEFQSTIDLRPLIGSVVLGSGTPINGITTDYLGVTRSETTPSIGAVENGVDEVGPNIAYTNLLKTASTNNRTLADVTIIDPSGVNTTAGTRPRVYYKRSTDGNEWNDNSSDTDGWKWTETDETGSPFDFTIDYSLLNGDSGVSLGTTVQYFITAQDLQATPFVSINSGTFAAAPASVALTASAFPIGGAIKSYAIVTALNGNVTIGTGGTYPSLTGPGGLFSSINSNLLGGNLTATVISDLTEDGANALNQWIEEPASSGFSLTIRPDGTTERLISGAPGNHLIRLNGSDLVIVDGRYNGKGKYLRFRNTNSTYSTVQFINGASGNLIKNTFLEGCGSIYGVVDFSTDVNHDNEIINCEIRDRSDGSGKPNYGISFYSVDNYNNKVYNCKIYNFDRIGVWINATNTLVDSNEFYMTSASSNSQVCCIQINNAPGTRIVKNKIHDLNGTSYANINAINYYGQSGLNMNVSIENNSIILSPTTTGFVTGIGYSGFSANSLDVYYNSIYIGGNIVSGSSSSYCINKANAAANYTLKNNALYNARTNTDGTGSHYAIYIGNTSGVSSLNYNDYYTDGSGGILGNWNNTDQVNLTGWQTASSQDANSVSADPLFNSTANLQPLSGSPLLAAGTPLAGINTDIKNVTRNAGTPTIGAYEQGGDFNNPDISYTLLGNASGVTSKSFPDVIITDLSGINNTAGTKPRVYYKRSTDANEWIDNTISSNGWKWKEANGSVSPFDFTIEYSMLYGGTGVAYGDVIQYFVVAEDLAITPNVGINSGSFNAIPTSVALTTDAFPIEGFLNSYLISTPLTGTIEVGEGKTYTTLTANTSTGLFKMLNEGSLLGDITVVICSNLTETGSVALNPLSYDGADYYTVTIQPYEGSRAIYTVSGNMAGSLITLNGSDHVVFDGNNHDLAFRNYSASSGATVFTLTNGASYNTIKDCDIGTGATSTSASTGILFDTGTANNYNIIDGNHIFKAYQGIYLEGSSSGDCTGNIIKNNIIGSEVDSLAIGSYGIYAKYQTDFEISGNEIMNIISSSCIPSTTGLGISYCNYTTISKNYIHDIIYSGSGGCGANGLYIYADEGTSVNNPHIMVSNNILRHIAGDSDVPLDVYVPAGIRIEGTDYITEGIDIYYNSVWLSNDPVNGLGSSYDPSGTWCAAIILNVVPTGINITNNIFYNCLGERPSYSLTTAGVAIWNMRWDAETFGDLDYNVYYSDSCDVNYLGKVNSNDGLGGLLDLTGWREFTGKDAHSVFANPRFMNGLCELTGSPSPAPGGGTPITAVTDDYNGESRDATHPTCGAFEYPWNAIWTANSSTSDWNTIGNWSTVTLPGMNMPVTIPTIPAGGGGVTFPVISGGQTGECKTLTIEEDASVTVQTSGVLNIENPNP